MNSEQKNCVCGAVIKISTQLCNACRKRYRVGDIEMWMAEKARPWLSMPWTDSDWIKEERDECERH